VVDHQLPILHSIIMTGAIPVFHKPTRNHFGIIRSAERVRDRTIRKNPPTPLLPTDADTVKPRIMT
jgi:arginine/lysine/ornithine decarboxylase